MGPDPIFTGSMILAAAGALWMFWAISRKVVKWGFLVMYFLIGACVTWAINPNVSPVLPILAGLCFSWAVMLIKRRIWKVVTSAAILTAMAFVMPVFFDQTPDRAQAQTRPAHKPAKPAPKTAPAKR